MPFRRLDIRCLKFVRDEYVYTLMGNISIFKKCNLRKTVTEGKYGTAGNNIWTVIGLQDARSKIYWSLQRIAVYFIGRVYLIYIHNE